MFIALGRLLLLLLAACTCGSVCRAVDELAPRPAWKTSKLKGAPTPPAPYRVQLRFPQIRFQRPTGALEIPGENRLLVTEMSGKIYSLPKSDAAAAAELVADLDTIVKADVSLFSVVLHPQFAENKYLFASYAHPGEGRHVRISRFTLTGDAPYSIAEGSEQVIITRPAGPHNAGDLHFGKDGMLYASTGDGAGPNPPDVLNTGQDVSDLLGSILRIDVDRPSGKLAYTIPADNPFVDQAGRRGEIWAYGLRNPWKFGIDRVSGDVFVADNGWETWEMIYRIERGGNYGWPVREGRAALRSDVTPGPTPILPPIKDHPHSEANSVIGGPVYRGEKLTRLQGAFVYGDYITGTIWAVWPEQKSGVPDTGGQATRGTSSTNWSHATLVDTDLQIVGFAEGSAGELFVIDYDVTGQIYELLPSDIPDTSATFPRKLSETGLFTVNGADMRNAPGVVAYRVVAPRWLDGATAFRGIAIPGNGKVTLATGDQPASYPEGTVFFKHIATHAKQGRMIETQVLLYQQGEWQPYSYLWDAEGPVARLVDPVGATRQLEFTTADGTKAERTWRVGAVNECKLCHNAGAGYVLGFVQSQLDLKHMDDPSQTQLARLWKQEVITGAPQMPFDDPRRLVDPHDKTQPLEERARSYLHANCSMCHHPRGNAIVSFYLRREMPFDKLNTNKGTIIGTFGMPDAKVIATGDPYRSILMYRMSKLGYGRMPYIGSQVVDGDGVALIAEWIRSLPPQDTAHSPPLTAGSPEAAALATVSAAEGDHAAAIQMLARSTSGSLALLERIYRGELSPADEKLAVAAGSQAASDIAGLWETFLPESQRRQRLGPKFDPSVVLSLKGDIARGKLIYYSDNGRCRACHEQTDPAASLGPTLAEINKKYPALPEMLTQILEPSRKIDDPYATYQIETSDGQVLTGLILREDAASLVLKTPDRKVITLELGAIESKTRSTKSLMPDGVLSDLTAQEAADLLEYLRNP